VVGRDPPQLLLGRVGRNAAEELADLHLPALEVGTQDRDLVRIADFDTLERFNSFAEQELTASGRT